MLCLIFIGRTSGSWFQMHSLILLGYPQNFWRLWHNYLRAAMLFLLDPRPCSVYTSFIWFLPSKVYFLLSSAGEVTSFRVPLPSRWMDNACSSLSLLGPFSILLSRCNYLGLELSTFNKGSWYAFELTLSPKGCTWHQALSRFFFFQPTSHYQRFDAGRLAFFGSSPSGSLHVLGSLFPRIFWLSVCFRVHHT